MNKIKNDNLYLTMSVVPNTPNSFYSELIRGIKIKLSKNDIKKINKASKFIKKSDRIVQLNDLGNIQYYEGFDSEKVHEDLDDLIYQECEIISDEEFYLNDNIHKFDEHECSHYISVSNDGFQIIFSLITNEEQVFYSSPIFNEKNIFKEQTIVYINVIEDLNKTSDIKYVAEIMYLGVFDKTKFINGEKIEIYAEHLWENDYYVDSVNNEIMDRSKSWDNQLNAFQDAIKISKQLGYFVVNKNDYTTL